jgi:hypothetical protein
MFKSYERYGDPYKLVEFRMMVLNDCSMDCKGCFYERDKNHYNDFGSALNLAKELKNHDYELETCYLLPTDIFDNKDNYKLFDDDNFAEIISMFEYVGVASTLENVFDETFYKIVKNKNSKTKIELQVNLLVSKLFDINYQIILKSRILKIKEKYGDDVIVNLAINTGFSLTEKEKNKLKQLLDFLSDDKIIELNFTFLYNKNISDVKKKSMMVESIKTINEMLNHYIKDNEKNYNDRTLLRKPAFTFVGDPNRTFLTPIIPFDEYVFIDDKKFLLPQSNYHGFIETYLNLNDINSVILEKCNDCDNLSYCMGKGYFTIAKHMTLGCHLDIK